MERGFLCGPRYVRARPLSACSTVAAVGSHAIPLEQRDGASRSRGNVEAGHGRRPCAQFANSLLGGERQRSRGRSKCPRLWVPRQQQKASSAWRTNSSPQVRLVFRMMHEQNGLFSNLGNASQRSVSRTAGLGWRPQAEECVLWLAPWTPGQS